MSKSTEVSVPGASAGAARERIAAAMVRLAGEQGLEKTTVAMVCAGAGVDRVTFDRCFDGKEDCFLRVHDEIAEELCKRVNAAYAGPRSWHDRVWAAAWTAMRFLIEDPARARFLVVEVNAAGRQARARRDGLLQRLADLIDAGRDELEDPGSISRRSAEIVSGAIYTMVLGKVQAGVIEAGEDFLPELVYMAMMPYLGARVAEDELLVEPLH